MDFSQDEITNLSLKYGDLLVCEGGDVGRTAIWRDELKDCLYQNHIHRLRRKNNNISPEFYVLWMQAASQVFGLYKGKEITTTIPNLSGGKLKSFLLPLPPTLAEQERIARALNEQIAVVEKARSAAAARLEAAKALPAAYLREIFESKGVKKWPYKHLRDVCEQIDYGYTASADFTLKEPRFLRISDIQNGLVDWDSVPGCKISETEEITNLLLDGDIVFARTGGTVGKSYLITNPPRAVFASYLIRLRPKKTVVYPEYLYSFFQSDNYWQQLRKSSRGGAQPNVNATLLGNLELPVPSLKQQQGLLLSLKEQMAYVTKIMKVTEIELDTISALPAAFLQRAFSGGL